MHVTTSEDIESLSSWSEIELGDARGNVVQDMTRAVATTSINSDICKLLQERPDLYNSIETLKLLLESCGEMPDVRAMVLGYIRCQDPHLLDISDHQLRTSDDDVRLVVASLPLEPQGWLSRAVQLILYSFQPLSVSELLMLRSSASKRSCGQHANTPNMML